MVPGYNHNIKYQGQIFHVQTEDSGLNNPHVITHVFIGGTIVASRKTDYSQATGRADVRQHVTELMQVQHKAALKALIHGAYDVPIAALKHHGQALSGPPPLNVAAGAQGRSSFGRQSGPPPAASVAAEAKPLPAAADAARPGFAAPLPTSHYVTQPSDAPDLPVPKRPIPPEEEGYAEAELIEPDDPSVDSLFNTLVVEKPLDEVITSFFGQSGAKK
jgi:hypothetical protein